MIPQTSRIRCVSRHPAAFVIVATLIACGDDTNDATPRSDIDTMESDAAESDVADMGSVDGDSRDTEPEDSESADAVSVDTTVTTPTGPTALASQFDGNLAGADYWGPDPEILSAGLGFSDIVGVPVDTLTEESVRAAGGAWSTAFSCGEDTRNITSTSTQTQVGAAYIIQTPYTGVQDGALGLDGLPVVFSWPADTSTLGLTDFRVTMNTGEVVSPLAVSPFPNSEENERNVIVIFGEFGNRIPSSEPNSRFPVRVEVVEDETPLLLVGPDGRVESAVGLFIVNESSPYDPNNGPRLVGAKLNRIDRSGVVGEGLAGLGAGMLIRPNDELLLYNEGDFKIRILTTGGFSPDGVRGVLPTDFETFFRLRVRGTDGEVIIDRAGVDFDVQGGTLRVVGLSELGAPEGGDVVYDGCYDEDLDNYIDIILVGDEAAARNIIAVEIPSLEGGYSAFYNPGGPGSTPFPDVVYTAPGPPDLEPVIIALDDPMRVTRRAP